MLALLLPYTQQTISILRFHCGRQILRPTGVFRHLWPVASPYALWPAIVPCGHPPPKHTLFTRHTPRQPFHHTLYLIRQYFNFSRLLDHFNFYPHFSATLATWEGFFYPWSRLPTPFIHLGATLFTYPFITTFYRGETLLGRFRRL